MKKLFIASVLLIGIVSSSCQKEKLKTVNWYELDRGYHWSPEPSIPVDYSFEMINHNKIVRFSSQADFLEFANFLTHKTYLDQPLNTSQLMNLDYSSNDLYAIAIDYDSQEWYELAGKSVKIDDAKQRVYIEFKVVTRVGGSGMGSFTDYLLVEIPKTYAGYEITGKKYLDEKSVMGSSSHDGQTEYSLY